MILKQKKHTTETKTHGTETAHSTETKKRTTETKTHGTETKNRTTETRKKWY